jgi:hypothetical protein
MKERKHTEEQFELVCNQRNKAILERDEERQRANALADECETLRAQLEWSTTEDHPLSEDDAIKAAHPTRTGKHDRYATAMRFVSARRSKFGLIELVNWLLYRIEEKKP